MDVEFCQMLLLHLLKRSCGFCLLFILCITLIDLHMLNHTYEVGNESHVVLVCGLFYVLLDSVCECSVDKFHICIHQRYWPVILFFSSVFGFGIRVMVAS